MGRGFQRLCRDDGSFLGVGAAQPGAAEEVGCGGEEAVVAREGGVVARVDGAPGARVVVLGEGVAGVADAVDAEGEGGEIFDGVDDVGEVVEGGDLDAVLDAHDAGGSVWHSRWAGGLEEDLGRGDDAREAPDPGGCHGLGVFGHGGFADHGEEGDDVESPPVLVVFALWPPAFVAVALGRGHRKIRSLVGGVTFGCVILLL